MNAQIPPQIRELWPGYLNKSLAPHDQAVMEHWINEHGDRHPELQAELNWLALTREQWRQATPTAEPEAGWHELLARIEAEPARQATPPVAAQASVWARLLSWLHTPALATSFAVLLLVQSLAVWMFWPGAGTDQNVRLMSDRTSSSQQADGTVTWQVTFAPSATAAQIQAALQSVQGQVISGPSALGIWTVRVPGSAHSDMQMQTLRQQAGVASVNAQP